MLYLGCFILVGSVDCRFNHSHSNNKVIPLNTAENSSWCKRCKILLQALHYSEKILDPYIQDIQYNPIYLILLPLEILMYSLRKLNWATQRSTTSVWHETTLTNFNWFKDVVSSISYIQNWTNQVFNGQTFHKKNDQFAAKSWKMSYSFFWHLQG